MQALKVDYSWSFRDATRSETSYLTHGYHRYPAKFIPQLASRVINENSQKGDLVCDPFMGSGTAIVEALVNGRRAYGTDINPVAVLIARAKTTPIAPKMLEQQIEYVLCRIQEALLSSSNNNNNNNPRYQDYNHRQPENFVNPFVCKRIDYWFPEEQKNELSLILSHVRDTKRKDIRTFLLCSFSNILKGCSRWMTKSVKPTRDKTKRSAPAHHSFVLQTNKMIKKNQELWQMLGHLNRRQAVLENRDARDLSLKDGSVSLIVTSPPYVTSYEYADLHQLTALWLGYSKELRDFRSRFIGSMQKDDKEVSLDSTLAKWIIEKLETKDKREALGAQKYFSEMQQCFVEMYRVLDHKGRAAIVIGDTDLKGVRIENAKVFIQTMTKIGFTKLQVIKRPIPSKILPLTRDKRTGRFAAATESDRLAYPTEFIIVMQKC